VIPKTVLFGVTRINGLPLWSIFRPADIFRNDVADVNTSKTGRGTFGIKKHLQSNDVHADQFRSISIKKCLPKSTREVMEVENFVDAIYYGWQGKW
jgi:hypothetical protein